MTAMVKDKLRDKRLVANSFSRAAPTYDSVAGLQRDTADCLLSWLPDIEPKVVMDLGSGTGYASPQLRARYPQALLLSLDLAEGMLAYARDRHALAQHKHVCGDAEQLPLADNSVDLVFSSLAVQWCECPELLFAELARVLKPGGQVLVATLGPATLVELKRAWAAVDDDCHVNEFLPLAQVNEAAVVLEPVKQEAQLRVLEYGKLGQLTHELKALGAHNVNARSHQGLSTRERLRKLTQAYERTRLTSGALPASYELYFCHWRKPQS
ncbi:malonyl-CoA O-methyltransferase [Marinobacterium lutimaris]|uniref:Malonyl-[acyl-carrier protein] O-methyltransferase n=1 Tax=Marinobacterium lutimaris TaxID=568106 RepID=A0A1H6CFU9_9GAMM|nr:malonyl-CoA O-methyltransferase [Marinobacterium lutimaris]